MSDQEPEPAAKPRRRPLRRVGVWGIMVMLSLVLLVLVGMGYFKGRPVAAPDWLQARIEDRFAAAVPEARISFGQMVFVLDEDWVPKVGLRDIAVRTLEGAEIVSFNEVRSALALKPLFEGVVQPKEVSLSGVFVTLIRDTNGRVTLSAGSGLAEGARRSVTPAELIAEMDAVLGTPALKALSSAEVQALTLRYEDQRTGRAWTVDGGRARISREGEDLAVAADLAVLSGGAGVATLEASYESRIGEGDAQFGVRFDGIAAQDIAAQGQAFAWLDVLRAPISGSVRSGLKADGSFEPVNATLQIGAGVLQPTPETRAVPFDSARSYFRYDPDQRLLEFDELSVRSKWVSVSASGMAALGELDAAGRLDDLVGQFTLSQLRANPMDLYEAPVSLGRADLDFQMKLNPFRLQLGRVQISDEGQTLQVSGTLEAGRKGWEVALDGQMDGLAPARLFALWPADLGARTRDWLVANLLEGQLHNIDVALRQTPGQARRSYLAFDYTGAQVRFMADMPPITGAQGHLSLTDNRLVIAVDKGQVSPPQGGAIALQGSAFIIPDVSARDGTPAVVRLNTRSSVTAALSLLNRKPLRVMERAGLPVTLAEGRAALQGTIALPLKRGTAGQIEYHFTGDLRAVRSETLVPERTLQVPLLRLVADNAGLSLSGEGQIDGVPFEGTWSQPIGTGNSASTLRGQVALNQTTLDTFGIALPPGTVDGNGSARVAIDFKRGAAPAFSLGSDLRGIRVAVPQVSWVKPRAATGRLQVSGSLGAVPKVERLEIQGAGLSAEGNVTLRDGGALERVRFDRLQVGNWLDIPVDLIGQGSGKPVEVALRGGSLDLRRAEFDAAPDSGGGGGAAGPPMQVTLDRLQITDTIALTNMRGRFATAKGLDGRFEALLNGGAAVQGQLIPQNGRSAVRLTSADAGGVLRSAGLLKQVVGGNLSLTLLPVGSGGAFDGRVRATGLRVKDAPGIAALLNAVSVVGLVNELNGDGIYFEEVDGDFRLTPDRITLTKSSAVGASMGLSMDGVYGLKTNIMQMQGVISPVYLLNGIGSVLTRKGEGVIGFNYTLTGPASQPKVSVNPLSALAPGFFREVFRRPAPTLPEVEGVTGSTLPEAATEPRTDRPRDLQVENPTEWR